MMYDIIKKIVSPEKEKKKNVKNFMVHKPTDGSYFIFLANIELQSCR